MGRLEFLAGGLVTLTAGLILAVGSQGVAGASDEGPITDPNTEGPRLLARLRAAVAEVPQAYRPGVLQALAQAGEHREAWIAALGQVPAPQLEGLAFLLTHMPPSDLTAMSAADLLENIDYAYQARAKCPWPAPDELFLNDVLPYANLDEARDPWRREMFDRYAARAWEHETAEEAVKWLNQALFEEYKVAYHPTKRPRPNQSPKESIEAGYASCSGLSILLVDGCRAVGIPARIAGIYQWKDGKGDAAGNHGGNHNWAEVWTGKWRHTGGGELGELDKAWFTEKTAGPAVDASDWRHRIHAASYAVTGVNFPLAWDPENKSIAAADVTARYKPVCGDPNTSP